MQAGSAGRVQATVVGSSALTGGELVPPSADAVLNATPSQSLSSGPWRDPGDKVVIQRNESTATSHISPVRRPPDAAAGEGGNPSGSFPATVGGGAERQTLLPHVVRDHPDADLSARLVHLWCHSSEFGVWWQSRWISWWGKAIVAGYLGALVDSKVEGGVDLQIEIRTQ